MHLHDVTHLSQRSRNVQDVSMMEEFLLLVQDLLLVPVLVLVSDVL